MSAQIAVLSIHALRKAEVLFQHCHTRGRNISTYLYVQIFCIHPYQCITEGRIGNKQQSQKTIARYYLNRSHSVIISIISPA